MKNKNLKTLLIGHMEICRFDHWIKNIFAVPGVLIALAYTPQALNWHLIQNLLLGFLALGLIASSNYVLNEILDAPFDRKHPRKHIRAVAGMRANIGAAYIQWLVLMIAGMVLGLQISRSFTRVLAMLWVMGCIYNMSPLRTKDIPYLDVLSEAINNPLRFMAGWCMMQSPYTPSANLLLSYWMLGCYLMVLKRYAEFRDIGDQAVAGSYRKSFAYYNENRLLVATMFYAAAAMLFLGAFIMRYKIELILSFPFVAWVMAIYMNLAFKSESAVQAPEKLYREPMLMLAVFLCSVVMIGLFFVNIPQIGEIFTPTLPRDKG